MSRSNLTKLLLAVALACPLGCGGSVSGVNPAEAAKTTPDFIMTAEAWAEEMKRSNPDEFQQKYMNKKVELTGTVASYRRPYPREEHYQFSNNGVYFVVIDDAGKKALPGQTVTVRGIVNQTDGSFSQAEILDVTGPLPPTFTVQQLIDMHKAGQPLPDYPVIVEGKVFAKMNCSKGSEICTDLTPKDAALQFSLCLNRFGPKGRDHPLDEKTITVGQRCCFLAHSFWTRDNRVYTSGYLLELLD